jgi:hypothetical protein
MKKLMLLLLGACCILLSGCGDKAEREARPSFMFFCFRKEIVSDDYHVPEMKSAAAAAYLQNRLKSLPGYVDSSYDLGSNMLTVRYKSSTIRKMNIEELIALSGFDVNHRPAYPDVKLPEGLK